MIALLASAAKVEPVWVGHNPIAYLLLALMFAFCLALIANILWGRR